MDTQLPSIEFRVVHRPEGPKFFICLFPDGAIHVDDISSPAPLRLSRLIDYPKTGETYATACLRLELVLFLLRFEGLESIT